MTAPDLQAALETVRRERPSVPDVPCMMCTHDYCECRTESESFIAALALIERRVGELEAGRDGLLRFEKHDPDIDVHGEPGDGLAAAFDEQRDRAVTAEARVVKLEAALREIADLHGDGEASDTAEFARAALDGKEK